MKLSQAIALGSTICAAGPNHSRFQVGSPRTTGCGLEMALEAIGNHHHWSDARLVWPWLASNNFYWLDGVVKRFDARVLTGKETLESFIDWVASIEPPETCSECRSASPVNEIQVCQECQQ